MLSGHNSECDQGPHEKVVRLLWISRLKELARKKMIYFSENKESSERKVHLVISSI